jgi:hypothetical protein
MTRSDYLARFEGRIHFNMKDLIWDSDAELKCRVFAWLAMLGKCLTADNLQKRGWPNTPTCPFMQCLP